MPLPRFAPPLRWWIIWWAPKGRPRCAEKHLLAQPLQQAPPGMQVKLLAQEGELYVLAQSRDRVANGRALRRQLKLLWRGSSSSTMQLSARGYGDLDHGRTPGDAGLIARRAEFHQQFRHPSSVLLKKLKLESSAQPPRNRRHRPCPPTPCCADL